MDFDLADDDCTIYIEELKSDDPNLKINAVSKIANIADILGPKRTKEELIPYIIEIIEECDNEDEFLVKLSDQLLLLKDKIGGKEFVHTLVAPLEILSSMEEISVREKAIESLIALSSDQDSNFFSTHFLQIIKQLGNWDNYPSRVSACYLLPCCYPHISSQEKLEIRQLFSELANDDTPMVRRATANNIAAMANVLEKEFIKLDLLPIWQLLMKDDIDSVKIKAIESSLKLFPAFTKQEINESLLPTLKNVDPENKSWRIRYGLAEVLPTVCNYVDKEIVKRDILNQFVEFLKDNEQEVKSIAVLKLPEICEKIPEKLIIDTLVPLLKNLTVDPSQHVRQSVAQILVKIAKLLSTENLIENFIPLINKAYKDEALDVRLTVISTFGLFHQMMGAENVKLHLIPLILEASAEKNWRSRLAVVEYLPKLCKEIGYELFKSDLEEFINSFLMDHFNAIREQTLLNYINLCEIFGYPRIKSMVTSGLEGLAKSSNYLFRITALHGIVKLKDVIPIQDLNIMYSNFTGKMIGDKVANVRLNVIKTFIGLKDKWKDSEKKNHIKALEPLKKDYDKDVKFLMSQI